MKKKNKRNFSFRTKNYIEPVQVQKEQEPQEKIEESIEASSSYIGTVCRYYSARVEHFQRIPVEPKHEPCDCKAHKANVRYMLIIGVEFAVSFLDVHVTLGELEQNVSHIMQEHN